MRRFRKTIRHPETLGRKKQNHTHYDQSIDLHGCTVEEARSRLTSAILNGNANSLLIIHGKGTGTLKREVRRFLQNNPNVTRVAFGEEANLPGGEGVTLAYLS